MPTNDDYRGELRLGDDGRLLYDAEREVLARCNQSGITSGLARASVPARIVSDALNALGRFRADRLEQAAAPNEPDPGDLAPLEVLRWRIRAGLEDATSSLIHDPRFDVADAHALKDLVGSYVGLGGDLELAPTVPGDEYARQADELARLYREHAQITECVDRLLDTVHGTAGEALAEMTGAGTRLEDFGRTLLELAIVRRGRRPEDDAR